MRVAYRHNLRRLTLLVTYAGLLAGAVFGCKLAVPPLETGDMVAIDGRVVTVDGSPVEGVVVQAARSEQPVRSAADGSFALENLPRGELNLLIEASVQSEVSLGAFEGSKRHGIVVRLDKAGQTRSVEVHRAGEVCVLNHLVRPASAPSPSARGTIYAERDEGSEGLSLKVDHMPIDRVFDVLLQDEPGNPKSLSVIGAIRTHGTEDEQGVGQLEFVAEDESEVADNMPFGTSVSNLVGRNLEIRDKQTGVTLLVANVPEPVDTDGPSKNARDDLVREGGPERARGNVRVKSTPDCSRDNFWIQIKGLERMRTYEICIACGGADKASALGGGAPVPAGTPTLSFGNTVAVPGETIEVPVMLNTNGETIVVAQFVAEYDDQFLTFLGVDIGADADAEGFVVLLVNETPPFAPSTPGTNNNVLVQIQDPQGTGTLNGDVEIATLRFEVASDAVGQSCIAFDPCKVDCSPPGQLHTFLNLPGVPALGGADDINLVSGCVTIRAFDCFQVTTSQGGEAHLFLKVKQCDALPCNVPCVRDLEGAAIEVRDVLTSALVLSGEVPTVD